MENKYHTIRSFIFNRLQDYCSTCFPVSEVVNDCIECNKRAKKKQIDRLRSNEANALVEEINNLFFFLHFLIRKEDCDIDCNVIHNLNECIGEDFEKELESYYNRLITDIHTDVESFREKLSRKVLFYYFILLYYVDRETLEEEEFQELYGDIDYYKKCFAELQLFKKPNQKLVLDKINH